MMSSRSLITVIAMTISMVSFMPEHVRASQCGDELKAFGYDGQLDHDTHYFECNDVESAKSLPGYRAFVDYTDDKIFSTNSSLVDTYCNVVEYLFNKGFTGALPIDRIVSKKVTDKAEELDKKYKTFLAEKPYSELTKKNEEFVFDLVYEFGFKQLEVTKQGENCKQTLNGIGYKGNFVADFLLFKTFQTLPTDKDDVKQKYISNYHFLMVISKDYVLFTDNNILDLNCDLIESLKAAGFDGTLETDSGKLSSIPADSVYKEEAKVYDAYLKRVKEELYQKAFKEAQLKVTLNLLMRFAIHKLGKIMY